MADALPMPSESSKQSLLIATKPLIPMRYPRLIATLWFTACGAAVGLVYAWINSAYMAGSVILFPLCAGLFALLAVVPGLLVGQHILNPSKTRTLAEAAGWGALVALAGHVFICSLITAFVLVGATVTHYFGSFADVLGGGITMFLYSLQQFGAFTFGGGAIGAATLYKLARLTHKPTGCALHGYGEGRNAIAGE